MTLWIFDTDHLSLLERGNLPIQRRLQPIMASSVAITIVTAEEKVKGRLATINGLSGMERIDRLAGCLQDVSDDSGRSQKFSDTAFFGYRLRSLS